MTPESAVPQPERVAAFFRKHRTGLVTLVFTDVVDSTALLHQLGDQAGTTFLQQRRQILRDILHGLPEAEEIETAGDSFLLVFAKPSDAVRFALLSQARLRAFSARAGLPVQERMGIHLGEVVISEHETEVKAKDLYGIQLATCARVMSLAAGGQIVLTRGVFDSARQVLKGEDIPGVGPLSWVSHGPYLLKGIEEAVEVCEVGEVGRSPLAAPKTSDKAQRQVRADEEPVLGWRPAVGQEVPNTKWVLEEKLGEGGFGEVWVGRHQAMKERRVFKFCFRADRVRSLKREMTLFRLIKERIGDHPNIVSLREVYFDQPPFYVEEDYAEGQDLATWCAARGGVEKVPLEVKLEIVAQVADALQAAHDAGVIHRDVKPGNILISGQRAVVSSQQEQADSSLVTRHSSPSVKLTDFGIGQVISAEYLAGVTKAGFTQTMLGSSSSGTGTTMYLAPEIIAGNPATTRSDIYSLGVVLYQLLVGDFRHPLTADWAKTVSDPLIREDLERCFAWEARARFPSAGELAQQMRRLPDRRIEREHRRRLESRLVLLRRLAVLGAALLLLVVAGFVYQRDQTRKVKRLAEENRQNLYAADVALAQRFLDENNYGQAQALLERHKPNPGESNLRGWEWRYLWKQCQSDELFTLGQHDGFVFSVAYAPDGTYAASGGLDGRVRIWDLKQRRGTDLTKQEDQVIALAIAPGGRTLAVCRSRETALWDLASHRPVWRFPNGCGPPAQMAFSPDGTSLFVPAGGGVRVLNVAPLSEKAFLRISSSQVQGIAVSAARRLLAAGDWEGKIRLWDLESLEPRASLQGDSGGVSALAFSPDGRVLAAGSLYGRGGPGEIRIWEVPEGRLVATLTNHLFWIGGLAFSPDGRTLLSGSADQTLILWDTADWHLRTRLRGNKNEVWPVACSPDGETVLSGSKDGQVKCWSLKQPVSARVSFSLPEPPRSYQLADAAVLFSGDHASFVTLTTSNSAVIWDTRSFQPRAELRIDVTNASGFALGYRAESLLVIRRGGAVMKYDMTTGSSEQVLDIGTNQWTVPVLSRAGNLYLLNRKVRGWYSGRLRVWQLSSRRELTGSPLEGEWFWLSPDEAMLAIEQPNGAVHIWDLGSRLRRRCTLEGHKGHVYGVCFSPDNRIVATTGEDGTARLWDPRTGRQVALLAQESGGFQGVNISPDGQRVVGALGSAQPALRFWHVATGRPLINLTGFSAFASESSYNSWFLDADTLLTQDARELRLWKAPSFAEIDAVEKAQASPSGPGGR